MPDETKNNQDDFSLDDALDDIASSEKSLLNEEPVSDSRHVYNQSKKASLKDKIKDLWKNPKKRKVLLGSLAFVVLILSVVPQSRYVMLNTVGIRSSASVKILDESTGQPLKNVTVKLRGVETKTNDEGIAKLEKLKLGTAQLQVQKRAFAEIDRKITVGWGSNPLGEQKLKPVGVQYSFDVKDFLSNKSIEKAEAFSGEYSAFSDADGRVVLTIEEPGEDTIDITIKAEGYRQEVLSQETENKEVQKVGMVPERKHFFVSKRTGKYDVYKIDVDGKNEQLILSGTGNERDDMTLVPHPSKDIVALVSTRENQRNRDGFLLSTLTMIDVNGNEVQTSSLGNSERMQIIGWSGDQLVYVKISAGASAASPDRHRLVTYNYETGVTKEIAKSNFFNDVILVGDKIYYAPSAAYQEEKVALYKVNANGENLKTIFDQEVWNIFRTDYDTIAFSVQDDWYELTMTDDRVLASNGPPPVQLTRVYVDGLNNKESLWIDQRDGKGALVSFNSESKEEKTIKSQSGLTYPARWMSSTAIVYRISTDQEVADYVVSIDGGEAKKIKDVTNTGGVDRWYYY